MTKTLDWQYSRNQHRHWVDDGELYCVDSQHHYRLWEIITDRPMGFIRRKTDVYTLRCRGLIVSRAKTVAALKTLAERQLDPAKYVEARSLVTGS